MKHVYLKSADPPHKRPGLNFCDLHCDAETIRTVTDEFAARERGIWRSITFDLDSVEDVPDSPYGCTVCGSTSHEFNHRDGIKYNVPPDTARERAYQEYRRRLMPWLWRTTPSKREFEAGWTLAMKHVET